MRTTEILADRAARGAACWMSNDRFVPCVFPDKNYHEGDFVPKKQSMRLRTPQFFAQKNPLAPLGLTHSRPAALKSFMVPYRSSHLRIDCVRFTPNLPVGRDDGAQTPFVQESNSQSWRPKVGWSSFRFTVTKVTHASFGDF
jgi:hypothetical protein